MTFQRIPEDDFPMLCAAFDVADELDGGLTLDDLDDQFLQKAKDACEKYALAWPPHLAELEEFFLVHREIRSR